MIERIDHDRDGEASLPHLQLIIFCGLQASGKSTFYRDTFAQTHLLLSKDLLKNHKHPALRQRTLLEEALQACRSVVVDNTNPTRADRAELVGLGKQYEADVICYYFPPDLKQNLERNQQRSGKAKVPNIAIFATNKRFEVPRWDEGFDHFYQVKIVEGSAFAIEMMEKEL